MTGANGFKHFLDDHGTIRKTAVLAEVDDVLRARIDVVGIGHPLCAKNRPSTDMLIAFRKSRRETDIASGVDDGAEICAFLGFGGAGRSYDRCHQS
jgi:hypothetical protein